MGRLQEEVWPRLERARCAWVVAEVDVSAPGIFVAGGGHLAGRADLAARDICTPLMRKRTIRGVPG